jgi:multidrug resistance efflux pump
LEVQEQLRQLEANLAKEQDELIKAELQAKIKELREKNEVHALVSGWVQALWVEQVEDLLTVHLRVVLGGEKS